MRFEPKLSKIFRWGQYSGPLRRRERASRVVIFFRTALHGTRNTRGRLVNVPRHGARDAEKRFCFVCDKFLFDLYYFCLLASYRTFSEHWYWALEQLCDVRRFFDPLIILPIVNIHLLWCLPPFQPLKPIRSTVFDPTSILLVERRSDLRTARHKRLSARWALGGAIKGVSCVIYNSTPERNTGYVY